jgi:NADPH-dependent ferric siderophore reductase
MDTLFKANVSYATPNAGAHIAAIYERMREIEFTAEFEGEDVVIDLGRDNARARLARRNEALTIDVESSTEQGVRLLRSFLGFQLERVAATENPEVVWEGFGADDTELPGLREMRFVSRELVTPLMMRITLAGEDLERYAHESYYVRLLFPPAGLDKPEWPKPGKNGRPVWPEAGKSPASRVYTVRSVDVIRGTMEIDFVLHEGPGVASDWARHAEPGDLIGLLGPAGTPLKPSDWYLIGGDETALPGIIRILEKVGPESVATVFIEIENAAERQAIAHGTNVSIHWLERNGLKAGQNDLLLNALKGVALPEHGTKLVWVGAESATAQEMRRYCKSDLGLVRGEHNIIGYWQFGKEIAAAQV